MPASKLHSCLEKRWVVNFSLFRCYWPVIYTHPLSIQIRTTETKPNPNPNTNPHPTDPTKPDHLTVYGGELLLERPTVQASIQC